MKRPYLNALMMALALCATALVSTPASACQLVCNATTAVFVGGSVGGQAGGDAKCAAEFPGFKFAKSISVLANIAGGNADGIGVLSGAVALNMGGSPSQDCDAWTQIGGSGTILTFNGASGRYSGTPINADYCNGNVKVKLICCNM